MTRRPRTNALRSRSGFTLAELMVAVLLTSLVAVATFRAMSIHADNTQFTAEMSALWEQLSVASDMLSTDVQGAAWSGTPNSAVDPLICPKPAQVYRGMIIDDGETTFSDALSMSGGDFGLNSNVDPDQCLFQSPVQLELYNPDSIVGDIITFSSDPLLPDTEAEWVALFTDHSLRIMAPSGYAQIVEVTGTDWNQREVTVSPTPTQAGGPETCGYQGTGGTDHEVTVMTWLRYRVLKRGGDAEDTILVREELAPDLTTPTLISGTRLVVAEDIVDLQCWADGLVAGGNDYVPDAEAVSGAFGDFVGSMTMAELNETSTKTHRARVFNYLLVGRTAREFTFLPHDPRNTASDLLNRWDLNGSSDDAALAQPLAGRIDLSNFIIRNLTVEP